MNNSLRPDITTSQDLSANPLNYTTSIGRRFKLLSVILKFSTAVSETVTITLDSVNGANYDWTIRTKILTAESQYIYLPDSEILCFAGDEIKVECTANNGTGTVYLTVKTQEVLK